MRASLHTQAVHVRICRGGKRSLNPYAPEPINDEERAGVGRVHDAFGSLIERNKQTEAELLLLLRRRPAALIEYEATLVV